MILNAALHSLKIFFPHISLSVAEALPAGGK